ncbi:MAG: nucleotidyltransferase domain-containing protein [Promethearchaeota archaeon]|nr:MAG: nucleotidyltransferase domain-containing protein [Candidatus Lokiarchaeota archaeon]
MLLLYKDDILKKIGHKYPNHDHNLEKLILFGSVATEKYSPGSDVDVLLVTTNKRETNDLFSNFKMKILLKYSVIINALYASPREFNSSIEPIYSTIKNEGKLLWEKKKIEKN